MFLEKRIKEKRIAKEMTQEDLGNLLNVSKVSVCNWEKGSKKPSTKNLIQLSKVLNTTIDYLIGSDVYAVSEDNQKYGVMLANEELSIIEELRKHNRLHEMLCDSPKRTLDYVDKKLF